MTSRKTVESINITREANMTFTLNLITHLYFKKVCYTWESDCTKHLPLRIKTLDKYNQFRKEVKSILLNNMIYTLEEYLQAVLE